MTSIALAMLPVVDRVDWIADEDRQTGWHISDCDGHLADNKGRRVLPQQPCNAIADERYLILGGRVWVKRN